jgi:hypothetical protein
MLELLPLKIVILRSRLWFRDQTLEVEFIRDLKEAIASKGSPSQKEEFRILDALDQLLRGNVGAADTMLTKPPREERLQPWHHLAGGRIASCQGRFEQAVRSAQTAQQLAEQGQSDRFVLCMAVLEEARHRLNSRARTAQEALDRCIQLARSIKARWIEAQALLLSARSRPDGAAS